jgi:hypothetical protein
MHASKILLTASFVFAIGIAPGAIGSAAAQTECQVTSSAFFRYQSETVEHTVVAPGPQGCYRTIRMRGGWSIDGVQIISPSRNGTAAVRGVGYSYQPRGGADSFTLRVTGADRNGRRGFSIIRVRVLG